MRGLVGLLQDEADSVNLSAMSALRMLSESRDGCDLLLDAEAIVGFVGCLSEMKRQPILLGEALFSLGNLTKLAESIKQAMAAGAVDRLMALLAEGEEVSGVRPSGRRGDSVGKQVPGLMILMILCRTPCRHLHNPKTPTPTTP